MSQIEEIIRKSITVPEYYRRYINPNVNLYSEPKQCCFNHKEKTPSFSYLASADKWSCFGECHLYGKDVIDMHRLRMKLDTRDKAIKSLCDILGIDNSNISIDIHKDFSKYDKEKSEMNILKQKANICSKTIDDYVKLDTIMTNGYENKDLIKELKLYVNERW